MSKRNGKVIADGRYYLVRTPDMRGVPFVDEGFARTNKRDAISTARAQARVFYDLTPKRNRRVSVYVMDPGKRPSLLYQCHWNRQLRRIVSEVL